MKRRILISLCWTILASVSALAQDTLYPVRDATDYSTVMNADHSAFVIDRAFEYKFTLGFPSSDATWFLPGTKAKLVLMWMRIENRSERPLDLNPASFTCVDDEGKPCALVAPGEAFDRIMAESGGRITITGKALQGLSLGKTGPPTTDEQLKADAMRYSLQSGQIGAHDLREGLIYFEAPPAKKFTVSIRLGGLWSKPFRFSNVKPK